MLKSTKVWLAVLGLGLLVNCDRLDNFTITQRSNAVVSQGTILEQLGGDLGFDGLLAFDLAQTQEFKNQGVKKNQIDSVYLKSLTLTIKDPPEGQDFTFVESLEFHVEAEGLERRMIASGGPFEAGLKTVGLNVEPLNLKPYAVAPSMDITTEGQGHRPEHETTIEARVVLDVDVDVSGAAGCD